MDVATSTSIPATEVDEVTAAAGLRRATDGADATPGVLEVVASPSPAVPVHLLSVIPRLLDRGLPVHLAVARHLVPEYSSLRVPLAGLAVSEVSSTLGDARAAGSLRQLVRVTPDVDVVHAHGFRASALALQSRRGPALVTTWYDLPLPTGRRGLSVRAAERLIARRSDVTVATSSELQTRAREVGARDVRLVPIALGGLAEDAGDRSAARRRLADTLGLRPDRPWVLVVGRLVPERSGLLLTLAERWNVLYPPPEVLAVGEGSPGVVTALRQAVADRGLPVHLLGDRLLGDQQDTADLMHASDVLVTTSRWESRPIAVQQAMQVGLPVVAARLAGIPELVADTGVLVDADDVEALAGEVASLLADPDRASRLARRARRRAGTFPSEDEVATTLVAIYGDVADRRLGRPAGASASPRPSP